MCARLSWLPSVAIVWLSIISAEPGFAETKADSIEAQILGQWKYEGKRSGAQISSLATFKSGGVYTCAMTVKFFGTKSKMSFEATWKMVGEDAVEIKVTKTSSKFLLPVGKVIKKEGVRIQDDVMMYQHDGKAEKEIRVPKPSKEPKAN